MNIIAKIKTTVLKPIIMAVSKPIPVTYVGENKALRIPEFLKYSSVKKVLVITDEFLYSSGLLAPLLLEIKEQEIKSVVFDKITPDPTFKMVEMALKASVGCDAVIALGGGSVIDAAKVVAAAARANKTPRELVGMFKVPCIPLPLIAVPTTAGTGSEATLAAIISDDITHIKNQILDPKLVPMLAVLDPVLSIGLPPRITAYTALDALTHALEAYVSEYATSKTDIYCENAIRMIYDNLQRVYKNPQDIKGREALLVASFYGGMAFTRTYVGYVHGFSHAISAKCGVPHGLANAVILPHVFKYYREVCCNKLARLYDIVNVKIRDISPQEKADSFIKSISTLLDNVHLEKRLNGFDKAFIDEVITLAFKECHGTYPVPCFLNRDEAKEILFNVCEN